MVIPCTTSFLYSASSLFLYQIPEEIVQLYKQLLMKISSSQEQQHQRKCMQFPVGETVQLSKQLLMRIEHLPKSIIKESAECVYINTVQVIEVVSVFSFIHLASEMNISKQVLRDALPAHITFKIKSFSLLSNSSIEKYESDDFEAGGYQWKLSLYPNGKSDENGGGHISMYLKMVKNQTHCLPCGWELDVFFRFLLLNQIQDKYLILGDIKGSTRRFHGAKRKWGCSRLLPLTTLNDASNGYLVDDTCVFGAEIFVCKSTGYEECLTMFKNPTTVSHTWKIESFSKISQEYVFSDLFDAGGRKWIVQLYPKGDSEGKNHSIAMYLWLADSGIHSPATKVYANFRLRVKNQILEEHMERKSEGSRFIHSKGRGWIKFIKLSEFNNNKKGFLVNDVCIIEADVTVLGVVKKHP